MRKVVFLGNCQTRRLQVLYSTEFAPANNDVISFVASYETLTNRVREALAEADIIVAQVIDSEHEVSLNKIETDADVVLFPNVMGVFLWPYSGVSHPLNKPLDYFQAGPFGAELGDRFLNRRMTECADPDSIVAEYEKYDVAKKMHVGRMYELLIERQRQRDEKCGFSCAEIIDQHLRSESLFLTPMNFELRLFNHIAHGVYRNLGVPTKDIVRVLGGQWRTPFPQFCQPIHPSVIAHFDLRYVGPNSLYRYHTGEMLTFQQYVNRYLRYDFNEPLLRGITLAHQAARSPERREELLTMLREGIAQAPGPAAAGHSAISHVLNVAGERAAARAAMEEALRIGPSEPNPSLAIANMMMEDADLTGAEDLLRRMLLTWPKVAEIHHRLAVLLSRANRHDEALDCAREAARLSPYRPHILNYLAHLLAHLGRCEEAKSAYCSSLDLQPRQLNVLKSYAGLLNRMNQRDLAIDAIRKAINLDPDNLQYREYLGHVYARDEQLESAEKAFLYVLARSPELVSAQLGYVNVLQRRGRTDAAITATRQALIANPNNPGLQDLMNRLRHSGKVGLVA